ncbi:MAG: hypothetical protein PVF87_04220 [Acidimicrobiia bacterium]
MKPTQAQTTYIERVGRWWESVSGSRNAGQILGWLMICDPAHQSSAQLMEALHISAGSISTQVRVLETIGLVERITFRGDRATYYQLRPNVWVEIMGGEEARIREMRELAAAAAAVRPVERPDRVDDLARVADFFLEQWPALMQRLSEFLEKERAS